MNNTSLRVAHPSFHEELHAITAADRDFLLAAPLISQAFAGEISRAQYLAFLGQAWHHVRHTVPLLMALGARLPDRHAGLRNNVLHYLEEETGHDDWILNDIEAAGGDRHAAARSAPNIETEAMVAYAWDTIMRGNPVGFFGMVFVLEGSSAALALRAADAIQKALGLPDRAFSYLRSHGTLDQEHVQDLASILDSLGDPEDRAAVTRCTRAMYWLYGQMFRGIDRNAGRTTTHKNKLETADEP
ncbi:MAG: iron-containing redox enzyme family protein [Gammaproteobacteria bacterium]